MKLLTILAVAGCIATLTVAIPIDDPRAQTPAASSQSAAHWKGRYVKTKRALTKHGNEVRALRRHIRRMASSSAIGSHPIERNLLCIHAGEGSWTDPNAPYYGGLQMDTSFQKAYGRAFYDALGTADNWPVSVQMAVGIRAILSGRGYYPWPTTGRRCGLIG